MFKWNHFFLVCFHWQTIGEVERENTKNDYTRVLSWSDSLLFFPSSASLCFWFSLFLFYFHFHSIDRIDKMNKFIKVDVNVFFLLQIAENERGEEELVKGLKMICCDTQKFMILEKTNKKKVKNSSYRSVHFVKIDRISFVYEYVRNRIQKFWTGEQRNYFQIKYNMEDNEWPLNWNLYFLSNCFKWISFLSLKL